jgi:hypothetical protein
MSAPTKITMKLRQFRALWGMINSTDGNLARSPHTHLETFLPAIKKLGYEVVSIVACFAHD